jgi:hypothetical protein
LLKLHGPVFAAVDALSFICNRRGDSQAGRRGFEPSLLLHAWVTRHAPRRNTWPARTNCFTRLRNRPCGSLFPYAHIASVLGRRQGARRTPSATAQTGPLADQLLGQCISPPAADRTRETGRIAAIYRISGAEVFASQLKTLVLSTPSCSERDRLRRRRQTRRAP